MRNTPYFILACVVCGGSLALAHGPQIQLTNDNNKITTRTVFLDEPYNDYPQPASAQTAVYVMPLAPINTFGGTAYWAQPSDMFPVSSPGLAWCYGWTYTDATHYTTTFPIGSNFVESLVGGLQKFDGTSFVTAPGGAQLEIFKSATNVGVSGSASTSVNLKTLVAPTAPNFDDHTAVSFQLLGDGVVPSTSHPPANVPDGIYLSQFKLSLPNQPAGSSIQDSNPFYFVLYKGVDPSAAVDAARIHFPTASIQLVPEPGLVSIAACAIATLCARPRREER